MKSNRSIQRCLSIMRAFRVQGRPTLAELARAVDLPHATVLRFLLTLEEEGYTAREGNHWRLTPLVFELGFAAMESLGISDALQDVLQQLANTYSGTANLGETHHDGVIIIGRAMAPAERRRLIVMNLRVGSVLPSTSALAQGLTMPVGQWTRFDYPDGNQISIATPIPHTDSRRLSVGISADAAEAAHGRLEQEMVPALLQAAETIKNILRIGAV